MKDNHTTQTAKNDLIFYPHTGGGSFDVSISGKPLVLRVLTGHLEGYIYSSDDNDRLYFVVDPGDKVDKFTQTDIYQFGILNEFGKDIAFVGWQWTKAIRSDSKKQDDGSFLIKADDLRRTNELMQMLEQEK